MLVAVICDKKKMYEISCNDIYEAELFLAKNHPEHYFGANLIQLDGPCRMLIGEREAYESNVQPAEIVRQHLNSCG